MACPRNQNCFWENDGNVLAVCRAGKTFKSVEDVLDVIDFFMQVLIVAGKVPLATTAADQMNVRAHMLSISCLDVLAEAHDRFRLKLIQKQSWEFAEGFPLALVKEFEALCQGQMQLRDRFYLDNGAMGRIGPIQGKCFDCDRQGHKRRDSDYPMYSQKFGARQVKKPFSGFSGYLDSPEGEREFFFDTNLPFGTTSSIQLFQLFQLFDTTLLSSTPCL